MRRHAGSGTCCSVFFFKRVLSSFQGYFQALMKHELGHKDSGLFAAREIESALLELEADTDCNRLSAAANRIGRKIIKNTINEI